MRPRQVALLALVSTLAIWSTLWLFRRVKTWAEPDLVAPAADLDADPDHVAVCMVAKDEHHSVREWVAHHASLGVGALYVYDDGSTPPMRGQLEDFIASGLVQYRLLEGPLQPGQRQQLAVYDNCLARNGARHAWMAFFDLDEFLIIMDGSPSLPALLDRHPGIGALAVNWRLFGSSGHVERPPGGVLQSFTACTPASYAKNAHIKSIVRPQHTRGASWSPHHFEFQPGYFAVNTNGSCVDGPLSSPPAADVLLLHHYALRSRREFGAKLAKSNAMGPGQEKQTDFWGRIEAAATKRCGYAAPLGAAAQARLAAAAAAAAANITAVAQPGS